MAKLKNKIFELASFSEHSVYIVFNVLQRHIFEEIPKIFALQIKINSEK